MNKRLRVPSTQSVLLRLRKRHHALAGAAELLERKHQILAQKALEMTPRWEELHRKAHQQLADAFGSYALTRMRSTSGELRQIVAGTPPMVQVRVEKTKLAGVPTFQTSTTVEPLRPRFGLLGSTSEMDRTIGSLAQATERLVRVAGEQATLRSLAEALTKVNRQVRTLRDHLIPLYESTIRDIEDTLDEEERAYLFGLKRVR